MTAKRRDAMAAPEMKAKATMRKREEVFFTVAGEIFEGSEYATGMALLAVGHDEDDCRRGQSIYRRDKYSK